MNCFDQANSLFPRAVRFGPLLLVSLVLGAIESRAANDPASHYLTFQVGLVGEASSRNESQQRTTNLVFADRLSGRIEIRSEPAEDGVVWSPRRDEAKIESRISQARTSETALTGEGGVQATETQSEIYSGTPRFDANIVNASVTIRPQAKRYDLQFTLMADLASTQEAVRQTESVRRSGAPSLRGNEPPKNKSQVVPLMMGPAQLGVPVNYNYLVAEVKDEALDADYGFLSGSKRIPVPKPAGWTGSWGIAIEVSWQVDATRPPVELRVTADGYAEWRPQGSIQEPAKPGNSLTARATLAPKDGQGKDVPKVKHIRFELLDTSREPGVCLNWPLHAKDQDYDLRLAAVAGGTLSKSDQALEVAEPGKNEDGHPYAEAKIDSYDFGGRASLRAICLLADGREIEGVMKGEGGEQNLVRLPKMKTPGWVADAWREQHGAGNLGDDDDEEKVEGQKHNGDGFTLYEEYRGWVVNGKHVEGEPKRKDFFILNHIGADGRGGIQLFERLSKLRVFSKLRGVEMSADDRLMNGNHRDAPHRVAQHGVVLSHEAGGAGGYNVGVEGADKSKAGRPRNVKLVYVETHHPNGAFAAKNSAEYNLSERDALSAYDRGVAHELMHAVGVDHHGEAVWLFVRCNFQGPSSPLNPTHRARYTTGSSYSPFQIDKPADFRSDRGATITLLWEDTKTDVVEDSIPAYTAALSKRQAAYATESSRTEMTATAARLAGMGIKHDAAFWSEYAADADAAPEHNQVLRVGYVGGTDCGNELCIMRYYFANAYRITGRENAYYLIRPGTGANRAGRDLCTSPAGTGTNASSHQPQSRFGDAHAGRGNCFGDICPNDAIPPRSVTLP